jgi:hypothetical protein
MKRWGWLLAGLIWFLILFAVTFDFEARSFGGFGVRVQPVKLIPKQYTATVAWLLLHFILLGMANTSFHWNNEGAQEEVNAASSMITSDNGCYQQQPGN